MVKSLAPLGPSSPDCPSIDLPKKQQQQQQQTMAQNLAFGRSGGSSSWADDDDADFPPMPVAPKLPACVGFEEEEERGRRRGD
jgi:hypothetical protein